MQGCTLKREAYFNSRLDVNFDKVNEAWSRAPGHGACLRSMSRTIAI